MVCYQNKNIFYNDRWLYEILCLLFHKGTLHLFCAKTKISTCKEFFFSICIKDSQCNTFLAMAFTFHQKTFVVKKYIKTSLVFHI